MRICYVCADSGVSLAKHNGSAAHVQAIVEAFRELGHDVELLLADVAGAETLGAPVGVIPRPAFARSLPSLARRAGVAGSEDTTASLRALRRLWINPGLEGALEDTIRRFRPDVVYERHSPFSVAGPIVAGRHRCPHVLEVNAPLAWEGRRHRGQALGHEAELLERLAFEASSHIVTVSAELRDALAQAGVDVAKIRVVPNGVDARRFAGVSPARLPELSGKVVVGFVGSLKAWHGVENLTRAFERLSATHPDLHLLIVGDGPLAGHVEDVRSRLAGRVTWTGALPPAAVPPLLAATHVAVAPYPELERFYFSPLKALEYMASGCAIVASRIGQLELLLRDGEDALMVPPGDVDALAAAIGRLAVDAGLRERLGARARDEVTRHHRWIDRADEILRMVERAAA